MLSRECELKAIVLAPVVLVLIQREMKYGGMTHVRVRFHQLQAR